MKSTSNIQQVASEPIPLARGLYWRGSVIWINKLIRGTRHQLSTGTGNPAEAERQLTQFLKEQGIASKPRKVRTPKPDLPRGLYWKGNVIWLSRKVDGTHHNISTGTDNLRLAEQFLADFNLKAFKGERLGMINLPHTTFEQLANRYMEQGSVNGLRPKSIARYRAVADQFRAFLRSQRMEAQDVRTIRPATIEDYKAWRTRQVVVRNGRHDSAADDVAANGAAPKTLQFEVQTIGTFFRHAHRLGIVADNPTSRVQPVRIPKQAPVFLEAEEADRLLRAAAAYDTWARGSSKVGPLLHDIFVTYLKTGLRLEELRHLEWRDVDFRRHDITVAAHKIVQSHRSIALSTQAAQELRAYTPNAFDQLSSDERRKLLGEAVTNCRGAVDVRYADLDLKSESVKLRSEIKWQPKSTGRVIPISPGLLPVLQRQGRQSNLVFPDPKTGGLWRLKMDRIVKRCAQQAKIAKPVHMHILRHTFATQLRRQSVALETIKELLGHADIRDTLIYAHFSPAEAKAAIPKIDVIAG